MAEKKVILKDGTDELLPKTSASMVFTESGQTVEAALQNAGGGGTGDSGIVDITSIYSKLNIQNGGIMGSEDLTALKGYIAAGKVLKATMDGTTLTFSYNISDTLITLSSSPMVIPSAYGAMMVISLLVDPETGEYVGVTDESRGQLVQQMIPSNVNAAQLCTMNGYTKPSAYSAISPSDNLNTAIGKLEAGIGSGGEGGEDVYYLPGEIMLLKSGATNEEITDAFGGLDYNQIRDAILGKRVYIEGRSSVYLKCMVPVSVAFGLGINVNLQWTHPDLERIYYLTYANIPSVRIIYIRGYDLDIRIRSLTSNSSTDNISAAVGGESGLKSIIQAVKDGNRLVIRDVKNGVNQDLLVSFYSIEDNGDMQLCFSGIGYGLWDGLGGSLFITYTKSSNTFSCTVIPISMGS